jgi:hypothetical protein
MIRSPIRKKRELHGAIAATLATIVLANGLFLLLVLAAPADRDVFASRIRTARTAQQATKR